jgi:hypothetical protein
MQTNMKTNHKYNPVEFHSTLEDTLNYLVIQANNIDDDDQHRPPPTKKSNSQFPQRLTENTIQDINKNKPK